MHYYFCFNDGKKGSKWLAQDPFKCDARFQTQVCVVSKAVSSAAVLCHCPVPDSPSVSRVIDNEMNSDESLTAGSRPEVIDKFVISKWGRSLQNSVRILLHKTPSSQGAMQKARALHCSQSRVWCLDLPARLFTVGPSLLQGCFSRGSPENSDLKRLSPGLVCLTHCVLSHW